jgi:elongation factor G
MLDAVLDYLPSPIDVGAVAGTDPDNGAEDSREPSDTAPFSALAFKLMNDPHVGNLTFFRVYSGQLTKGSYVYNASKGARSASGAFCGCTPTSAKRWTRSFSGEIAAAVGLQDTTTGDTLADEKNPILLESITFPEPVIEMSIEPKTKADQDKMGQALSRLSPRTRRSGCTRTRRPVRRSSGAWASCTWRSSWTA